MASIMIDRQSLWLHLPVQDQRFYTKAVEVDAHTLKEVTRVYDEFTQVETFLKGLYEATEGRAPTPEVPAFMKPKRKASGKTSKQRQEQASSSSES